MALPIRHDSSVKIKYRKRVLIVEDYDFIRNLLKDLIEQDGHMVTTASDGVEAMEILEAAEKPFDLMVLDINMPRKDGFEVLREIRGENNQRFGDLKVLVLTGTESDIPKIRQARDLDVHGFLCKAEPPDYTLSMIRSALF